MEYSFQRNIHKTGSWLIKTQKNQTKNKEKKKEKVPKDNDDIFDKLKENDCKPTIQYQVKLSFKNEYLMNAFSGNEIW